MNWSKDKSIKLSLVFLTVFKLALIVADVYSVFFLPERLDNCGLSTRTVWGIQLGLIIGSVCAWILVVKLTKLLKNIRSELVFTKENVDLLRTVSWCCAGGAIASLIATFFFPAFFFVSVCAAFMMLIVRIVKNAFQQAVDMKQELDLTI